MPGPVPKDESIRQRRNRSATRAVLAAERTRQRAPRLPRRGEGEWHALTRTWWRLVWHSPQAAEFVEADTPELLVLANLYDAFWCTGSLDVAKEIRLLSREFGLTPMSRRSLQWTIAKADEATERRRTRRARPEARDEQLQLDARMVLVK